MRKILEHFGSLMNFETKAEKVDNNSIIKGFCLVRY